MSKHTYSKALILDNPLCAETDPDMFFPKKNDSKTSKQAQELCQHCPEMVACREYVLKTSDIYYGVWGGLNMKTILQMRARINREKKQYGNKAA